VYDLKTYMKGIIGMGFTIGVPNILQRIDSQGWIRNSIKGLEPGGLGTEDPSGFHGKKPVRGSGYDVPDKLKRNKLGYNC